MNNVGFTEDFRKGNRTGLNDITTKHTPSWKSSLKLSHLPSCPCQTLYPTREGIPLYYNEHFTCTSAPNWEQQTELTEAGSEVSSVQGSSFWRFGWFGREKKEQSGKQVEWWLEGLAGPDAWLKRCRQQVLRDGGWLGVELERCHREGGWQKTALPLRGQWGPPHPKDP